MVFASQFEYNDALSNDWDLEICAFDNNASDTTSTRLELNPVTDELINKNIDYGAANGDPIAFDITLIHGSGNEKYFNREELREISQWLLTPNVHWLKLYDEEYEDYWCLGRFTKITKTKLGGHSPAITLTFSSVFHYYYSDVITKSFSVNGNSEIEIRNFGDEIEGWMHPSVEIHMKQAGNISIKNTLEKDSFQLSNLKNGEVITIDGYNLIISSNNNTSALTPKIFGDNFNRHWIKLYRGKNILQATGNFDITFKYREARRIGEF